MVLSQVDPSVLVAQLSIVEVCGSAVIGGIFGLLLNRQSKKQDAQRKADLEYRSEREAKEELRQERDAALYGVVLSTARGTEVLLHKAHGDNLNGDVEHCLESIQKSIGEYNGLANAQMSKLG